ncbi:hypothetical protein PQR46_39920 [Paraburkholderia sediminicola]|uniref:hypothetical protein n=1 Tax=Paraburkholderia sediminicola TaxID=458836 RepID=UPI0038BC9C73
MAKSEPPMKIARSSIAETLCPETTSAMPARALQQTRRSCRTAPFPDQWERSPPGNRRVALANVQAYIRDSSGTTRTSHVGDVCNTSGNASVNRVEYDNFAIAKVCDEQEMPTSIIAPVIKPVGATGQPNVADVFRRQVV